MPTYSFEQIQATPSKAFNLWLGGILAALAWLALALLTQLYPNRGLPTPFTREFAIAAAIAAGLLLAIAILPGPFGRLRRRLRVAGPWLTALPLLLGLWVLLTQKLRVLPPPFFAPPQALIEVYMDDWRRLGECLLRSLWLLLNGLTLGALTGFVTGLAIGWSTRIGYWVHPVLRILGPIPSTALVPLCFFFFPSSRSASIFLIALASWFPLTVLTWSGVASVDKAYYEVARTLGANSRFLIFRVAIPAALPHVFVGLFMALGASFSVLIVAEMLGVKSGLGWYLQWAQGWAAYPNMYAALLVMALLCSGLITLLFKVRDRVLSWQQGAVKW